MGNCYGSVKCWQNQLNLCYTLAPGPKCHRKDVGAQSGLTIVLWFSSFDLCYTFFLQSAVKSYLPEINDLSPAYKLWKANECWLSNTFIPVVQPAITVMIEGQQNSTFGFVGSKKYKKILKNKRSKQM